jgi:hypothetical protein
MPKRREWLLVVMLLGGMIAEIWLIYQVYVWGW